MARWDTQPRLKGENRLSPLSDNGRHFGQSLSDLAGVQGFEPGFRVQRPASCQLDDNPTYFGFVAATVRSDTAAVRRRLSQYRGKRRSHSADTLARREQFGRTIEAGMKQFQRLVDSDSVKRGRIIDGRAAFELFATSGSPGDDAELAERDIGVNEESAPSSRDIRSCRGRGREAVRRRPRRSVGDVGQVPHRHPPPARRLTASSGHARGAARQSHHRRALRFDYCIRENWSRKR